MALIPYNLLIDFIQNNNLWFARELQYIAECTIFENQLFIYKYFSNINKSNGSMKRDSLDCYLMSYSDKI
jgi:hypothetical protein